MGNFLQSFSAFNVNGINNLVYIMSSNLWSILIALGAAFTVIMKLKEETDYAVREEQNIL